jgi:hypothetical protein
MCGCNGFSGNGGGGTPAAPTPVPTWFPCMEFQFSQFTGFAALTGDIQIYSLLSRGTIEGAVIKTKTVFAGAGITGLNFSVGIVGDLAKIISPYNGLAAVSDTNFGTGDQLQLENFGAAVSIRLAAVAVGANLSALTQGVGCLWLKGARLPAP